MADLPPNHHAEYAQFTGLFGYLAGLTMTVGRGGDARLVADLAGLGPDDRLLDIGCGPGTAARVGARRAAGVIGVDPSRPMLRLGALISGLRRTGTDIDWVLAGAEELPMPDDSVTVCWSLAAVHHWPELERGLTEVARVVAPGGRFLAVEKRSPPGATGNASHGWTDQQAESFAAMLPSYGFHDAEVAFRQTGRRKVVVVRAIR